MMRPPPSATLFPYTTLFRSRPLGRDFFARSVHEVAPDLLGVTLLVDGVGGRIVEDRKSTRLNSSHRCISYAVFCLKKKTYQLTSGHAPRSSNLVRRRHPYTT